MIWFQLRVIDIDRSRFTMEIMDGDKHIGDVGNNGLNNPDVKCEALSWWIMPEYRGRGIVAQAVLDYMKVFGPDKIYQAMINEDNKASQRVAEKIGFTFFSQGISFWYHPLNRQQTWNERGRRTYIITYKGINHVKLSNVA